VTSRRSPLRCVDLEVAVDLLAAPFYYRLLISAEPIDAGFGRRVTDAVLTYVRHGDAPTT
jgi:hypothetical protein